MKSIDYLKDISEIKNLMNKSSKFTSLSGLSGVLAGVYALIGAGYYYYMIQKSGHNLLTFSNELINKTIIIMIVVVFSITITTLFFTSKRAKITDEKLGNHPTKNIISAYLTTLGLGSIFILILYFKGDYEYLLSCLFLFYGLALINASKHTSNIVKPLGIIQVITGLLCAIVPKYGFWFWVISFGIVHLIYGGIIYFKYDKNN
jgi:hypothetical protein